MTARDTADADAPVSLAKAGDGDAATDATASDAAADATASDAAGATADSADSADSADTAGRGRRADGRRRDRRRHRADDVDDTGTGDAGTGDTGTDDTGTGDTGAAAPGRRRPRRRLLVVLLVLAALFAGVSAAVHYATRPDPVAGLTSSQQAAIDAATQAAMNLQTFRRSSFDQDFANAQASLTQAYGQEFASRKDALKEQLDKAGRDATATVKSAGLVSSSGDQAVVLVVTNAVQTADNGQTTPFVFSRLQLTMQRVDGKWLVSDLTNVGLS